MSELPSWGDAKRVAVDVETRDPQLIKLGPGVRRDGYVVGISFALERGPAHYLPIHHESGGNVDPETIWRYLRDQGRNFKGILVGANLPYDLDYLEENRVTFPRVKFFRDVQVAEPLIDENQFQYSLDAIAARYKMPGKSEGQLGLAARAWGLDPKKDLWKLPARHVGAYAEQDVRLPLALLRRQERVIDEQGLWDIYNLESRVLPILVKMRRRGVRIDQDRLDEVEQIYAQKETSALARIKHETGVSIGLGELDQKKLIERAFMSLGIALPRTASGQPATAKDVIGAIDHPVAKAFLEAKKNDKIRRDFVNSVRKHLIRGRAHCTFNQLRVTRDSGDDKGARYGRLSSSDFNFQQQPKDSVWRSIYVPDEGGLWAALDYSQQEPRWIVHYATMTHCTRALEAAEKYRNDPTTDNHWMMARMIWGADATKAQRGQAKIIFLGLCYGMGGAKLCRNLGLPTEMKEIYGAVREAAGPEGAAVLAEFDEKVPFIRQLAKKAQIRAEAYGIVKTQAGRHCHFPKKPGGRGYDWAYKALNRIIQGSSADQTKLALVLAEAAGHRIQLQVHDELDLTVGIPREARECAEIMETCVKMLVPSKVDIEIGPSWGDAEKLE